MKALVVLVALAACTGAVPYTYHYHYYGHHPGDQGYNGRHGPAGDYHGRPARHGYHDNRDAGQLGQRRTDQGRPEESPTQTKNQDGDGEEKRIWRFALGSNAGAYEYLDTDGHLSGFNIDVIKAVCREAKERCHYIVDKYENCWLADGQNEYPGTGIMSGWYDACFGYLPTPKRLNSFNFTVPYINTPSVALYAKDASQEDSEETEHSLDLSGTTVVTINGLVSTDCLSRQRALNGAQSAPAYVNTYAELARYLREDEADYALLPVDLAGEVGGLHRVSTSFTCSDEGAGIMAHYGSPLITWWNKAFAEIQRKSIFTTICELAKNKHGQHGAIDCIGEK